MPDRDSVIDGLDEIIHYNGEQMFYNDIFIRGIADDALELLKEQEPHVMTLEEWIRTPEPADGECMCYEIKDKGLQAMLVKAFDGGRHLYGKAFRCWTSRPTDEQRKAAKWND